VGTGGLLKIRNAEPEAKFKAREATPFL